MSLGLPRARVVAPAVWALLLAGPPTAAAESGRSVTSAPGPDLLLQRQYTFTGEVRDILLLGDEVWAATGGGLVIHRRPDGAHLATLTSADGLPGNSLRSLVVADADHVMVGGDFGAALVDVKRVQLGKPHAIAKLGCENGCTRFDPVYAMAPAPGGLWLLRHQSGLELWARSKDGAWLRKSEGKRGVGAWRALAVASAPVLGGLDGRLWFEGTLDMKATMFTLSFPVLALQARGNEVAIATGEKLLRAGRDGVSTLVLQETGASRSPAASALSAPRPDGGILVGTARGELFALVKHDLVRMADGLPGRVTAIAADGDRVWLGLGRAGLHLFVPGAPARALRPTGELCDNHVIALLDLRGRMVAATFDQGACVLDRGAWHALAGLPSPMLHGLGSDGQDLFVATSNGLVRFDGRLQPRPFGRGDPGVLRWVAQSAATAIAQIDATSLAITSAYGLVQVRRDGGRLAAEFSSHRAGVPLKLTSVAAADGELWLGSETQGVKSLGKGAQPARHFQDPEDLPENWVTAVSAASADDLWVGTCQHGVAHLRGKNRQLIDRRNLLPDNMVVALAADPSGAFIGTLGGLSFAAAQGLAGRSYGWDAGLPDPRAAALLLAGSDLWLGTEAGLAHFRVR